MTAQAQWTQIEAALDEILALPESEWPEACARIAGNDDVLLTEINSLLACTRGVDRVLDHPLTVPNLEIRGVIGLAAGTRVGAYRRSGRLTEAEVQLRRAVELRQTLDDPDSPWLAQARINLAACLIGRHQTREARSLLKTAAVAQSHQPLLRESYRRELEDAKAMLHAAI